MLLQADGEGVVAYSEDLSFSFYLDYDITGHVIEIDFPKEILLNWRPKDKALFWTQTVLQRVSRGDWCQRRGDCGYLNPQPAACGAINKLSQIRSIFGLSTGLGPLSSENT